MKTLFFCVAVFIFAAAQAQPDGIKPAAKGGRVYGTPVTPEGVAVDVNNVSGKLANGTFEGKITGKVKEVCKAMGCWITLEKSDGTAVMVKTKDHAYLMPQSLVGKTVVVDGTASVKEVSEAQRRHLAEDAGASNEEIKKIKGAVQEVQVIAKGVEVLD